MTDSMIEEVVMSSLRSSIGEFRIDSRERGPPLWQGYVPLQHIRLKSNLVTGSSRHIAALNLLRSRAGL
jgi:hypothetical protein